MDQRFIALWIGGPMGAPQSAPARYHHQPFESDHNTR